MIFIEEVYIHVEKSRRTNNNKLHKIYNFLLIIIIIYLFIKCNIESFKYRIMSLTLIYSSFKLNL
jgi:hypothetical protein